MAGISQLTVRRRIAVLFLGAASCIFLLVLRMFWVQVVMNGRLTSSALDQRLRPVPVDARRGAIYDRNGQKLAVSVSADAVYAVPVEVKKPRETAEKLSPVLGMSAGDIEEKLKRKSASEWLKKRIPPEQARRVRELDLPGIGVVENPQRYYPNGSLAAQVLGIAGIDNQGLEGLEVYYDRYLRGSPGRVEAERDAAGREIPGGLRKYVAPQDGSDLVLTIDKVAQYIAERELAKAIHDTGAKRGVVILLAPKTGEILAMANLPSFDPNSFADYPAANRRNVAVSDLYEPGSTFKVVTAATALEERIVTPDRRFFCPGFMMVGRDRVGCWLPGGHGAESFVEGAESSCNIVFGTLGKELGGEKFYKYIRAFGFGQPTEIDFPGEGVGVVHLPNQVPLVGWVNIGFGQGLSMTPLQLLDAVAAVANDGRLMRPHLLKEVRRGDQVTEVVKPTEVRQVVSEGTAKEVGRILRSVVVNGSGKRGDVEGYRVAGKTGTAQIAEAGGYSRTKVVASFVGFAPFDDPQMAGIVALYEPTSAVTYGGTIAAPVFQAIAKDVLPHLKVQPRFDKPVKSAEGESVPQVVEVPNARNYPRQEAESIVRGAGLSAAFEGDGDVVMDQVPKPGATVNAGTRVILKTPLPQTVGKGLVSFE